MSINERLSLYIEIHRKCFIDHHFTLICNQLCSLTETIQLETFFFDHRPPSIENFFGGIYYYYTVNQYNKNILPVFRNNY